MERSRPDPWPDYEYRSNSESFESGLDRSRPRSRYEGSRSRSRYEQSPPRERSEYETRRSYDFSPRRDDRETGAGYRLERSQSRYENREENILSMSPRYREEEDFTRQTGRREEYYFEERTDRRNRIAEDFDNRENDGYSARFPNSSRYQDVEDVSHRSSYVDRITGPLRSNKFVSPPRRIVYEESKTNPFDRLGPKAEVSDDEFYSTDRIDDNLCESSRFGNLHSSWTEHKPNLDINYRIFSRDRDNEYSGDHITQPSYAEAFSRENYMEDFETFPQQTVSMVRQEFQERQTASPVQDFYPERDVSVGRQYSQFRHAFSSSTSTSESEATRRNIQDKSDFPGGSRQVGGTYDEWEQSPCKDRLKSVRDSQELMRDRGGNRKLDRGEFSLRRGEEAKRRNSYGGREQAARIGKFEGSKHVERMDYPTARKQIEEREQQEIKRDYPENIEPLKRRDGLDQERYRNQRSVDHQNRFSSPLPKISMSEDKVPGTKRKLSSDLSRSTSRGRSEAIKERRGNQDKTKSSGRSSSDRKYHLGKRVSSGSIGKRKNNEAPRSSMMDLTDSRRLSRTSFQPSDSRNSTSTRRANSPNKVENVSVKKKKMDEADKLRLLLLEEELKRTKEKLMKTEMKENKDMLVSRRDVQLDKHQIDKPKLPSKLYETECFVVLVQDMTECGIVEMVGGDGTHVYAFFYKHDAITSQDGNDKMSVKFPIGLKLKANAWLVNEDNKIPYIIARLWSPDIILPSSIMSKINNIEPEQSIMRMYTSLSPDLSWKLPTNRCLPRNRDEIVMYEDHIKASKSDDSSFRRRNLSSDVDVVIIPDIIRTNLLNSPPKISPINRETHIVNFEEEARKKLMLLSAHSYTGRNSNIQQNKKETEEVSKSNFAKGTHSCPPPPSSHFFNQAISTNLQQIEAMKTEASGNMTADSTKLCPPPPSGHCFTYQDKSTNFQQNIKVTEVFGNLPEKQVKVQPPPSQGHNIFYDDEKNNMHHNVAVTGVYGNVSADSDGLCPPPPPGHFFTHQEKTSNFQSNMEATNKFVNIPANSANVQICPQPPQGHIFTHQDEGTYTQQNMQKTKEFRNMSVGNAEFGTQFPPPHLVKGITYKENMQKTEESINSVVTNVVFCPSKSSGQFKTEQKDLTNTTYHNSLSANTNYTCLNSVFTQSQVAKQAFPTRQGSMIALHEKPSPQSSHVQYSVPLTSPSLGEESEYQESYLNYEAGKNQSSDYANLQLAPCFGKPLPTTLLEKSHHTSPHHKSELNTEDIPIFGKQMPKSAIKTSFHFPSRSIAAEKMFEETLSDNSLKVSMHLKKLSKVRSSEIFLDNDNSDIETPEDETEVLFGKPINDKDKYEQFTLKVDSYISNIGILKISSSQKVIFHANQVWVKQPCSIRAYCPFLEIFPLDCLEKEIPIGTQVRCLALKVSKTYYQAVALWKENNHDFPPRALEIARDSKSELKQVFDEFVFPTGSKYCGDIGEPRPYLKGYIQDYITYELGIIKVNYGEADNRYDSALFHLNQVWTACKRGGFSILKDSIHKSPPNLCLPVGTEVCFVYRDLPCESSHLKFQAYAVWKNTDNFKLPRQIGSIFNEYTAYYSEKRNQENLIVDLNCKHDLLKQHSKLYSPNPYVIPVVLNGLPENWVAVISDLYNCGFGLIKISHLEPGKDLSAALKLDVPDLYCVFHYSTFFLKNGKCCSNKDKNLIRQGDHVNLIARSIIPEQSSASILRVVKAHMQFGSKLPYISMQAIVVVHESSEQSYYSLPDNVPQPVVMNMKPISFNSDQNNTQVYMNINLMDTLKTQLYKQILLNGLFKKRVILTGVDNFMRNFELNPVIEPCDRDKLYQELDTNRTRDLIFGAFRQHVSYGNFNFPALLQDVSCQIAHISFHYRYQPTEGILSIDLDGTKVQAYVEFANLKLAGLNALPPLRIEEIAPVYMNLEFKCVAHLVTTVGCVQYVCTNIYSKHHKFQGPLPAVSPAKLCNYQSAMKRLCPNDPVSACVTQTGSLNIGKPAGPVIESSDFRQTSTCNISQSQNCITDIKKLGTVNTGKYDSSPPHHHLVDKPLTNDSEALKIFGQQFPSKEIFPRSSHTCNLPMSSTLKKPVQSPEDYDPESVYDSDYEYSETPNEGALNKEKKYEDLTEFERQVHDKKKTKKEEFLQMKRKVRWAKLVLQIEVKKIMRSPNNFICTTCGFEGGLSEAEKHLKEDIHWDNMFDVYCKELDTVKPQTFGNQKRLIENNKSKPKPLNVFQNSSDDDCLEGVLVSEPENSSVQSTLDVKVNKSIKFKLQFKGNDTEKSECLRTTSSMPSPITAFTNTGSNILLQKTEANISNINVKCSSIQDGGFTDEPKQVSDAFNISKSPLVNFELPEIYMFTETKLSEMGNFQGKNSLLKKVGDCLEGDAQTLIKSEFSNVEKNILKITNQAHYVCTKMSYLEKELQSSRVHYNEWFCKYCGICSEGQEMEKHLKSNYHWTKVIITASGQNQMSKSLKTDSDIIEDVFGRVSLVLNEVVAIVSFRHENSSLHAVLDISGINNTSSSRIITSKSDNMLTVLKKGYPVRMNLCCSWKTSHKFWYYATAAHIGDQADWKHPLPKPETVQSIKENKIREPIYIASTSFVKANEELLIKKLSSSYPEYLFNQLVKIVLISDDYCLGEIENIDNAPFCVITRALIKNNSNNGDIKKGELFKIGAYLLDHESQAPYLCHDFYPYSNSKCIEPIRHAELKQKQIDVFSSIIASSSFVQHKDLRR